MDKAEFRQAMLDVCAAYPGWAKKFGSSRTEARRNRYRGYIADALYDKMLTMMPPSSSAGGAPSEREKGKPTEYTATVPIDPTSAAAICDCIACRRSRETVAA